MAQQPLSDAQDRFLQIEAVDDLRHYLESMVSMDFIPEWLSTHGDDLENSDQPVLDELGNDLITTMTRHLEFDVALNALVDHQARMYHVSPTDRDYVQAALRPLCAKVYYSLRPFLMDRRRADMHFERWKHHFLIVRITAPLPDKP